jgi:hypothetical protein
MKRRKPEPKPGGIQSKPFRVRLPGFVASQDVGLGDAISRITYAAGITPCGGCRERARRLNRWVVFQR